MVQDADEMEKQNPSGYIRRADDDIEPTGDSPDIAPQPLEEDESNARELFMDDSKAEAVTDRMIVPLITIGINPMAAQIVTSTIRSLKGATLFIEVYGRGHIMADTSDPRMALNAVGLDALDLKPSRRPEICGI